MKRKLMFLNLALVALLVAGGFELNRRIAQAQSRYEILQRFDAPKDTPAFPSPQAPERVRQADYLPIVDKLLFYKDRNAIVEVEAPAENVIQRPPLPLLAGVMNLGEGPIALMAASAKAVPKPVTVGEQIGEYTFLGFAGDNLKLSWQGEEIEVEQDKLAGEAASSPVHEARADGASSGSSSPAARRLAARHQAIKAEAKAQPAAETRKTIGGRYNIGTEIRPGAFRADPKDPSPEGTEFEGYRKVVRKNPFGTQSWWERKDAAQK